MGSIFDEIFRSKNGFRGNITNSIHQRIIYLDSDHSNDPIKYIFNLCMHFKPIFYNFQNDLALSPTLSRFFLEYWQFFMRFLLIQSINVFLHDLLISYFDVLKIHSFIN